MIALNIRKCNFSKYFQQSRSTNGWQLAQTQYLVCVRPIRAHSAPYLVCVNFFICSVLLNFWYICQFCYFCLFVLLISLLLMSTAMMTAAASVVTAYMSFSMVMVMVIALNIRVKCQFSGNKCLHCRICMSYYATI